MKRKYFKLAKTILAFILIGIMLITTAYPVQAETSVSTISLSLSGKYAVIMDMDSGKVLYSKKGKTRCHNASTTKLMTAIVAVEKNKSLRKKIKISSNASSTIAVKLGMSTGDSYYLRDLLHGMLLMSANDTAVAIAEGTSGSVDRFMKEVNKKAKEIGCKNTQFGTPNGLRSSKTHYTTAYDLALITRYAYNNETIRNILKKKSYSFKSTKGRRHRVTSTNQLLRSKSYYSVGKTGNGQTAKYCYTGVYTYQGHSYVIVTLGSSYEGGRWSDAKKMMAACKKNAKEVRKNLTLNKTAMEIKVEESAELKVQKIKAKVKWFSKNEEIATVDKNGKVTGKKEGQTIIVAKVYGKTLKCKVKVIEGAATPYVQ